MAEKVLFVHDGPILLNKEKGKYFAVHYSNKIIERYQFFGEEVTFLMRGKDVGAEEGKKYSLISNPSFRHIGIPNFKSATTFYRKWEAKEIIKEAVESHDVIITRIPSAAGTIAFHYARNIGKPVLVECVACVYDALWNYNWKGKLLAHYKYVQMKRLMRKATHTVYVTSEFLQSRYSTDGKSIGCSDVVLKSIDNAVLEKRIEKIENSEKSTLTLGTVAALDVPYKGQADVIRAIALLKKQGFKAEYKLVGNGDPANLERIIKEENVDDCVEIIGPLPHDQVFDFLDGIDVYIQPSRQEGLPRAMVEALSRGCLTTGANTAGIPELIDDGFVFKAGDLNAINNILKSIDNKMLKDQAERNVQEAMKYRSEALDEKRLAFYERFKTDYNL